MSIRDEVVDILANKAAVMTQRPASDFNADTQFDADLHLKSVQYVQMSAALEDEYEVEVPYMEFRKMKTFGDAAAFIAEQFGE